MSDEPANSHLLILTAEIISAVAARSEVTTEQLPDAIRSVYVALSGASGGDASFLAVERAQPAVPVKRSIFPDYIVCLEDGQKLKLLKRHLATYYGLTPAQYRQRWGLPHDYPMVAPQYAARRSELAVEAGLSRKRSRGQRGGVPVR